MEIEPFCIKINTARRLLEKANGFQIETAAAVILAEHLNDVGSQIVNEILQLIEEDNSLRQLHGFVPRRRVTSSDVRRALQK